MGVYASILALVHGRRGTTDPREIVRRLRAPRVAVEPLHRIWFIRTAPAPLGIVRVANVSTTGIGLVRAPGIACAAEGDTITGMIAVVRASYPMTLRVVRVSGDVVGCAFAAVSPRFVAALEDHLRVELGALGDGDVRPGRRRLPSPTVREFHGPGSSELYLVEHDARVALFCLVFHGYYLEGGEDRPVRFGVLSADGSLHDAIDPMIGALDMIEAEQLAMVIRCISAIPGLAPSARDAILQHLC